MLSIRQPDSLAHILVQVSKPTRESSRRDDSGLESWYCTPLLPPYLVYCVAPLLRCPIVFLIPLSHPRQVVMWVRARRLVIGTEPISVVERGGAQRHPLRDQSSAPPHLFVTLFTSLFPFDDLGCVDYSCTSIMVIFPQSLIFERGKTSKCWYQIKICILIAFRRIKVRGLYRESCKIFPRTQKRASSLVPHQVTPVVDRSRRISTLLIVLLSDLLLLHLPLTFRQVC